MISGVNKSTGLELGDKALIMIEFASECESALTEHIAKVSGDGAAGLDVSEMEMDEV